jgi:hypothetical protein
MTDSMRTRPMTQFQGAVLAIITFLLLLALSIPLTVGQNRLQDADERACALRNQIVTEHNELATRMANLERKATSNTDAQREQFAQAWEDSLLPPANAQC